MARKRVITPIYPIDTYVITYNPFTNHLLTSWDIQVPEGYDDDIFADHVPYMFHPGKLFNPESCASQIGSIFRKQKSE